MTALLEGRNLSKHFTIGPLFGRRVTLRAVDHVDLNGAEITGLHGRALREARSRMQLVFQNPVASLNPRKRVRESLVRPMQLRGVAAAEARERVDGLLDLVGLDPRAAERYPHEFSG